jgi:hypothetical protein
MVRTESGHIGHNDVGMGLCIGIIGMEWKSAKRVFSPG